MPPPPTYQPTPPSDSISAEGQGMGQVTCLEPQPEHDMHSTQMVDMEDVTMNIEQRRPWWQARLEQGGQPYSDTDTNPPPPTHPTPPLTFRASPGGMLGGVRAVCNGAFAAECGSLASAIPWAG